MEWIQTLSKTLAFLTVQESPLAACWLGKIACSDCNSPTIFHINNIIGTSCSSFTGIENVLQRINQNSVLRHELYWEMVRGLTFGWISLWSYSWLCSWAWAWGPGACRWLAPLSSWPDHSAPPWGWCCLGDREMEEENKWRLREREGGLGRKDISVCNIIISLTFLLFNMATNIYIYCRAACSA